MKDIAHDHSDGRARHQERQEKRGAKIIAHGGLRDAVYAHRQQQPDRDLRRHRQYGEFERIAKADRYAHIAQQPLVIGQLDIIRRLEDIPAKQT